MLRTVIAHESGDGITIAHCPFCGSGQVVGRSDGNAECQFCNQSFMVRVQPMFSAFPQSVDGMPVQIPGMPPPSPAGMDPGMDPNADPDADPGADPGMDPAGGGQFPPGADSGGGNATGGNPFGGSGPPGSSAPGGGKSDSKDDKDKAKDKDGGSPPPFGGNGKKSFRTAAGARLDHAAYVDYLAAALEGRR